VRCRPAGADGLWTVSTGFGGKPVFFDAKLDFLVDIGFRGVWRFESGRSNARAFAGRRTVGGIIGGNAFT
jgi:hypothetical protein